MHYSELTANILAWLDRTDASVVAAVPTFIRLAEAVFNRNLRTIWQECRMETPVVADGIYKLPADWLGHRFVECLNDQVRITYYRRIPALTELAPNNWLATNHPDLYLYGALANAEAFLKNDPRIGLWKVAAGEALESLIDLSERAKYDGQDMVVRPRQNSTARIRYLDSANFADLEPGDEPAFTVSGQTLMIWPLP